MAPEDLTWTCLERWDFLPASVDVRTVRIIVKTPWSKKTSAVTVTTSDETGTTFAATEVREKTLDRETTSGAEGHRAMISGVEVPVLIEMTVRTSGVVVVDRRRTLDETKVRRWIMVHLGRSVVHALIDRGRAWDEAGLHIYREGVHVGLRRKAWSLNHR